jgi:hypothetical protein
LACTTERTSRVSISRSFCDESRGGVERRQKRS